MKIARGFAWAGAIAVLGACGSPAGESARSTFGNAAGADLARPLTGARSRMSSDAKNANLLYLSDLGSGDVYVYSYPGLQLEGTLTGFKAPHGLCADRSGDVFVTDTGMSQVFEYAHGGTTPIATLDDAGLSPVACAVDPRTGDVAVTNLTVARGSGEGNVAIYPAGSSTATTYVAPNIYFYYSCAYDGKGNLYADGSTQHVNAFGLAEMPRGQSTFSAITLNQSIQTPGGLAWDGKHLAVGDQGVASQGSTIYEFAIADGYGTEVGTTPLDGSTDVASYWLDGKKLIAPDASGNVFIWRYPAGGAPQKTIGGFGNPHGAAVSKAH